MRAIDQFLLFLLSSDLLKDVVLPWLLVGGVLVTRRGSVIAKESIAPRIEFILVAWCLSIAVRMAGAVKMIEVTNKTAVSVIYLTAAILLFYVYVALVTRLIGNFRLLTLPWLNSRPLLILASSSFVIFMIFAGIIFGPLSVSHFDFYWALGATIVLALVLPDRANHSNVKTMQTSYVTKESSVSSEPSAGHAVAPELQATKAEIFSKLVSSSQVKTMQLRIRKSQRSGVLGKVLFVLDARAELSAEEQALVKKYGLGKTVVYDSEARKKRANAAYGNFDDAANTSGFGGASVAASLWRSAKGLASATMMALSLRITIDGLVSGQHIECKDLDELLGAEAAIVSACKNLKTYLDTARTFDGREEVIEF